MKSVVIYGSTGTGKRVYQQICRKYNVIYFVDENPDRIGKSNGGIEIRSRDDLMKDKPDFIVMGILTGFDEAVEWLKSIGYDETSILSSYVDLSLRCRKATLQCLAQIIGEYKIEGDVAELGVYRGDFARCINEAFPDRHLFLFDTFEGFPEMDLTLEIANGRLKNEIGRLSNTSVEYVLGKMRYPEQCVVRKGYFPDTAIGLENIIYSFVNIDTDLYPSIRTGLDYFWRRLSVGGYIMVHDYFSDAYSGARQAIEEFSKKNAIGFSPIGDMHSVIFTKPVGSVI